MLVSFMQTYQISQNGTNVEKEEKFDQTMVTKIIHQFKIDGLLPQAKAAMCGHLELAKELSDPIPTETIKKIPGNKAVWVAIFAELSEFAVFFIAIKFFPNSHDSIHLVMQSWSLSGFNLFNKK